MSLSSSLQVLGRSMLQYMINAIAVELSVRYVVRYLLRDTVVVRRVRPWFVRPISLA